MNTEIYIEGQKADLSGDFFAEFTYTVNDIKEFATRETSFSKTIVLPGTEWNNRLFGHAFELSIYNPYDPTQPNILANFNAAKSAKCRVLVNGIQVVKGVIRLMEIKLNAGVFEYEAAIFGELGGLITSIGNRLLSGNGDMAGGLTVDDDLDFSAYNQNWTTANIFASWAAQDSTGGGSGVYYPLIDYGLCTTDRIAFSYQSMRPALYVKEYIDKIFEKAGYTYDCPFFSTALFKRLIVPHNSDKVYAMLNQLIDNRAAIVTFWITNATVSAKNINFANSIVLNNFTASYSTGALGSQFTYTGTAGYIILSSRVALTYTGGEGKLRVTCRIYVNATEVAGSSFDMMQPAGDSQIVDISLDSGPVVLLPTDVVTVNVSAAALGAGPAGSWAISINQETRISAVAETATAIEAVYGDPLNINALIPRGILQRDFFLSICKMFNLYVVEDADIEKHVIIKPFTDFFDNSLPIDWSQKIDRSKEISLLPMGEVNARYFNFLYEKDTDYDNQRYFDAYGKGYADRTFDAGLDFIKDKKDLKIIFGPSPLVGVSGLDKAVTRIMKLNGTAEERVASKIRILQAKRISVASWTILQDDLTTSMGTTTYYGYAGHVDDPGLPQGIDLNFGAPAEIYWSPANPYLAINLFNEYYSPYMAEITNKDSNLLRGYAYLTPLDIMQLDFSKGILIYGQVYRLNKIEDYNAVEETTAKIEMLKVINLVY